MPPWNALPHITAHLFSPSCLTCGRVSVIAECAECRRRPLLRAATPLGHPVYAMASYKSEQTQLSRIADVVHRLKFSEQTALAARLGSALARRCESNNLRVASVIPVPLHPTRLVERGYNQSVLIARGFAQRSGAQLQLRVLQRARATEQQARLTAAQRGSNMSGAFTAHPRSTATEVYLLDDVVTTGRTADACIQALAIQDIRVLGVLCCALAGHPRS